MRINTVHVPASQPVLQPQKANTRREDLTSKSSISGNNRPNFFMQIPFAFFRMATFMLSLIIYRTPRLKKVYIPEMTPAQKKEYEDKVSGYWTDFALTRKGPSYSEKIQLVHQFMTFRNYALNEGKSFTSKRVWAELDVGRGGSTWIIDFSKDLQRDLKRFLKALSSQDPIHRGKGPDITFTFKFTGIKDFGIGPIRERGTLFTMKNTLGTNGTAITREVTKKRTRTRYHFFK
ncbi:MAG: hypothetical protein P0S96_07125 [Simkaniaceae bacterium]|nr:hypothetical protein [Candidatus Sacchlamyda saccharinae]